MQLRDDGWSGGVQKASPAMTADQRKEVKPGGANVAAIATRKLATDGLVSQHMTQIDGHLEKANRTLGTRVGQQFAREQARIDGGTTHAVVATRSALHGQKS